MHVKKVKRQRVLSVFSLVMINVIAVDSLRTLPISAEYGFSLIAYYCFAAITFFIPVALVAAELATAWPQTGGIYVWVRQAFGKRVAFITIWLQWIYNIVWYPTILAFIAATLCYLFAPDYAENKVYLVTMVLTLFWLATLANCFGMRVSSIVSTLGAIAGTLVPMLFITLLGVMWLYRGMPAHIDISWHALMPDLSSLSNLTLFSGVLFGLLGMEMSAVHAEEVKNPQRDYPKALLISTIIIFSSLMFGSLAIALVVPQQKLSLVSGLIEAFDIFFQAYHWHWLTPIVAILIVVGSLSGVAAWIIGPTKGLLVAAEDGSIPEKFTKVNRHGAPVNLLIAQGVIFSLLSTVFLSMDSINASYWVLSALTAQLALLVYVFMFAAAIKLRFSHPNAKRTFKIPGGNKAMIAVAGIGLLTCVTVIFLGFIPPAQIKISNNYLFEGFLIGGMLIFVILPALLSKKH